MRASLSNNTFSLPPKYFYDAKGSELFEQICNSKEYYLTREETQLLRERADDLVAHARPQHIIEFGCGKLAKISFLLDACERQKICCTFSPIDICEAALVDLSTQLLALYPWLRINAYVGDYHAGFTNIDLPRGRRLALFMGSTIGNFSPEQAVDFLREVHAILGEDGVLLLGADRIKDPNILEAAYDDSDGVTARFNLNLLKVLNVELKADFVCDNFRHSAVFNEPYARIEMHLISEKDQIVYFAKLGQSMKLRRGETIVTEISRKFNDEKLHQLMRRGSFQIEHHILAANKHFSLLLARKV